MKITRVVCLVLFCSFLSVSHGYISPKCPDGWRYYVAEDSCMKVYKTGMSFNDARKTCRKDNGDLVKVTSDAKADLLHKWFGDGGMWIGLTDIRKEGTFEWVDRTPPTSYTSWRNGEPNNYKGNEDCAVLMHTKSRHWNDLGCHVRNVFVCEMSIAHISRVSLFTADLVEMKTRLTVGKKIIFGNVNSNIGGHYNPYTGEYTAPARGLYEFQLQATMKSPSTVPARVELTIMAASVGQIKLIATDDDEFDQAHVHTYVRLEKGDKVAVYVRATDNCPDCLVNEENTIFNGRYIECLECDPSVTSCAKKSQ